MGSKKVKRKKTQNKKIEVQCRDCKELFEEIAHMEKSQRWGEYILFEHMCKDFERVFQMNRKVRIKVWV